MTDGTPRLPAGFDDLQPFTADWVLPTQRERYLKRLASSMEDMQAFYDAAFARIDDAMAYLEAFTVDELDEEGRHLLWLYCSLCNVSFPIEVWRQQRVPDSGAAEFIPVLTPAV